MLDNRELDDREKAFASEYIINKGNAFKAALAAGYAKYTSQHAYEWLIPAPTNPNTKRHLSFKPYLKDYIDKQLEKINSEKIADAKEVMEYLTTVMRGKSKSEIVVIESVGEGRSTARRMQKEPDEKEKLKAAETLSKILGISKEKLDVTTNQIVLVDSVPEDW